MVPKPQKSKKFLVDDEDDRALHEASFPRNADSNCKPPKHLIISEDGMASSWKKWLQQWKWYATASCLSTRPASIQVASFMSAIGPDVIDVYNSFSLDNDESEDLDIIIMLALGTLATPKLRIIEENPDRFSEFDMKLTKLVAAKEKSNVVISPISVKLVLAMLYEGARGNTAKELQRVLDIKDSKALSANRLSVILQSLQASNKGYDIAVGTKLFLDKEASTTPAFEQRIKNLYNGTIEMIDFDKTSEAVSKINAWAKTVTRGHIKHLLSEVDTRESTVLLLVNALYFKGLWENQFPLNQTKEDTFYVDGVSPIQVPFMNAVHNLQYIESGDLKSMVVRLPYQGGKFAMYILLPFSKTGMPALVQGMTPEIVRKAVNEMQSVSVQLKLPKFSIDFTAGLAPVLKELGLNDMFSPTANLSGIAHSAKDLVVSNVIQKTALEVNEQGTTAAVATSIDLVSKFGDHIVDFEATHPFILYIEDETTNTVVFVAKVSNPEETGKPILSAAPQAPPPAPPAASNAGKPTG